MTCTADCPDCPAVAPEGDPEDVPHELHVTVVPARPYNRTIRDFQRVCDVVGVRAVVMETHADTGSRTEIQLMTASTVRGSDRDARRALAELGDNLAYFGWDPIRAKIESAPWHPRAVTQPLGGLPDMAYWETHVPLWIPPGRATVALFREVYRLQGYLSRNVLRRPRPDGAERWSLSLRSCFLGRTQQQFQAEFVRDTMTAHGFSPEEPRTEFTWFDHCLDPLMAGGPPFGVQVPQTQHEA